MQGGVGAAVAAVTAWAVPNHAASACRRAIAAPGFGKREMKRSYQGSSEMTCVTISVLQIWVDNIWILLPATRVMQTVLPLSLFLSLEAPLCRGQNQSSSYEVY